MNVELISITKPVGKLSHVETKDLIAYTARVSNPDNQLNFETSEKLIRYLLKKTHVSPFEMVDMTLEIQTTRDIGRQILRHKSFAFQEFSQRYSTVTTEMVERECRIQDQKNRQNSFATPDEGLAKAWKLSQSYVWNAITPIYELYASKGVAKEQIRAILPEGLTETTMYMKGSIRSWFFYCLVRCHPGTQKEHRDIANLVWVEVQKQFPCFEHLNMEKLSITYQEMFEKILEDSYEGE